jgi:hypothetical protein
MKTHETPVGVPVLSPKKARELAGKLPAAAVDAKRRTQPTHVSADTPAAEIKRG